MDQLFYSIENHVRMQKIVTLLSVISHIIYDRMLHDDRFWICSDSNEWRLFIICRDVCGRWRRGQCLGIIATSGVNIFLVVFTLLRWNVLTVWVVFLLLCEGRLCEMGHDAIVVMCVTVVVILQECFVYFLHIISWAFPLLFLIFHVTFSSLTTPCQYSPSPTRSMI